MPHPSARRPGRRALATIVAVALLGALLTACGGGSGSHPKDMRPWFALYVSRMLTDDTLRHVYGFQPLAEPYVGTCSHGQADVSWQGTMRPADGAGSPAGVSLAVLSRVTLDSKLPPSQFTVVGASEQSQQLSNTVVLFPSRYSRLQVTAPLGTNLVMVGFIGCDPKASPSGSPSPTG